MRELSQIWLQTRYESRKKPKLFSILGYLVELIIRIWKSENFFLLNLANLAIFLHGKSKLYFSRRSFAVEYQTTFPWFFLFKQHLENSRHEGKYICVKFGYVAQSTINLPSCQHKTRAFIAKKMYSKLKVLKSCVV
jgi:hypothetical protein